MQFFGPGPVYFEEGDCAKLWFGAFERLVSGFFLPTGVCVLKDTHRGSGNLDHPMPLAPPIPPHPPEPFIDFGTQTCLETLSVF